MGLNKEKHIKDLEEKGYIILNKQEIEKASSMGKFKCVECGESFGRRVKSAKKTNPCCNKCCYRIASGKLSKSKTPLEKWESFFREKGFKDYFFEENKCYIKCRRCGRIQRKVYSDMIKQKHFDLCGDCAKTEYQNTLDSKNILNNKLKSMEIKTRCVDNRIHFGNKMRVKFVCECGRPFNRKPNTVLSGLYLCPYCTDKRSYNEIHISKLLDGKYSYEMEYVFQDCKRKRPLPFDFYISDLNVCIEYDGEYHYKNIANRVDLQKRKEIDDIKTQYCLNNNIYLIRIKYTNKNYDEDLIKCLNNISQGNLEPTMIEIK